MKELSESPLQRFIDTMNAQEQVSRSKYHLTLGRLIHALEEAPYNYDVRTSDNNEAVLAVARSYRGYYCDLAIAPTFIPDQGATVQSLLKSLREVLGTSLEGYKGGDFHMGPNTPLWVAGWGEASGHAIIDFEVDNVDEVFYLRTKDLHE